jgi:hypothetical protein
MVFLLCGFGGPCRIKPSGGTAVAKVQDGAAAGDSRNGLRDHAAIVIPGSPKARAKIRRPARSAAAVLPSPSYPAGLEPPGHHAALNLSKML